MNKFLLPIGLGVLLIASGIFNIVQHNQSKGAVKKLAFFESHFGTYESLLESTKQADEAKAKREHTISVSIKTNIPESQILTLKTLIEKQTGVQSVQYVSAEQAIADFKTKHQNDPMTLQALNKLGTNPLGATLTVTVSDPSIKQSLINMIQSNDKNAVVYRINS